VGAYAREIAVDVERGAARGTLEDHVFEEMRDARFLWRFVACSGADEKPQRRRPGRGVSLAEDGQAVGKRRVVELHGVVSGLNGRLAAVLRTAANRAACGTRRAVASLTACGHDLMDNLRLWADQFDLAGARIDHEGMEILLRQVRLLAL